MRFPGNAASTTLDPAPDGMATVDYANGVFKVTISKPDQQDPPDDVPFSVVVVV